MVGRMGSVLKSRVRSFVIACLLFGSACSDSAPNGPVLESVNGAESEASTPGLPSELGVTTEADLPCPGNLVEPPPDFKRVLDVVALPASPDYPNALQTSARDAQDGSVYYFAKTGLSWQGDAAFEIEVPVELRSKMAIGWGGPAQPAHVVRVDCQLADSWMVLPGGY